MKSKTFSKRLELKKDTVSRLNIDELKAAQGGATFVICSKAETGCGYFCSNYPSICGTC